MVMLVATVDNQSTIPYHRHTQSSNGRLLSKDDTAIEGRIIDYIFQSNNIRYMNRLWSMISARLIFSTKLILHLYSVKNVDGSVNQNVVTGLQFY